jgi:deazaflavin-dependent oxidoreductase (nitroreductase family)
MSTSSEYDDFNQNLIAEFRANNGQVTGMFAGAPLMLLTTTGAKSGQPRTMPLVHTRDGDNLVVIASKGGAPTNPDWYHNLKANPEATVELPGETFTVRAREATGEERDRLYAAQAAVMPNFAEYQTQTTRQIPLFVLERVS